MATEVLTGDLELEWEIPPRLIGQNIREWMLGGAAVALKDGVVHIGRCDNETVKFFGSIGSRVLEGVTSALESTDSTYSKDPEFDIAVSSDLVKCSYSTMDHEFLSYLKQILSWICLISRNVTTDVIMVSRGYWSKNTFHLHLKDAVYWHGSNWTKLIKGVIVACLDQTIPKGPLLSTVFAITQQMAEACRPFHIGQGLIYFSGFTALVPIKLCKDGSILWDVEEKWSDTFSISEIKCMKTRWYQRKSWFQTLDLKMLQSAPVLIK